MGLRETTMSAGKVVIAGLAGASISACLGHSALGQTEAALTRDVASSTCNLSDGSTVVALEGPGSDEPSNPGTEEISAAPGRFWSLLGVERNE